MYVKQVQGILPALPDWSVKMMNSVFKTRNSAVKTRNSAGGWEDKLVDLIFWVDIFLNFKTGYDKVMSHLYKEFIIYIKNSSFI